MCGCMCEHSSVCLHVWMCACGSSRGRADREGFCSTSSKQQPVSVHQDPADGGNAGGFWGGWEESHCFKETRHYCRAEHLIQACASTLQLTITKRRWGEYGGGGGGGGGWFLYPALPVFLCCKQDRSKEVAITTCHAASTLFSIFLHLSSWDLSSNRIKQGKYFS